MALASVSLDDKYRLDHGRVFLTGVQALARLPMLQHARDRAAGLNTAGYVSGYRGSPLGGLDTALHDAQRFLASHNIKFQPGVNEDLAATAIWGTQQLHLFPDPRVDGIFAMWYGKGPGVDRCGDVFKHANYAGTAKHGGVLLVAGDDHSARSSAVAHQSEHMFSACGIPVLAPAGLQEYLDLGLHGWAMSRYSGCWVAMKTTSDTVESSATVEVDPQRVQIRLPEDFVLPPDGVNIRWPDPQLVQEHRMQESKVYAALAYARANRLNYLVYDSPRPRLGIIACGKAWLDVRQALDDLGIDANVAADIGLRLYKVGMPWPLEADGVRRFAEGLEEILVVEEKRQIIEYQLKEMLYNWKEGVRPRVVGKFDETGEWPAPHHAWLLPPTAELTPAIVARAIAARIGRFHTSERIRERLAFLEAKDQALSKPKLALMRTPYFCPGCPHNLSTRVPEGSCALGGVGCHLMAVWMGRNTVSISQMGGEGATWLGMAAHSGTKHVFANMGDGTYYHSGLLAIRAAIAAGVNITYKLLYNDAVAMTGGQPVDGPLTVPQITRQIESEGVARIVVLADDPEKYGDNPGFAAGVELRHRDELERTQRELRETPGVTVLVYDQTCAAEKRRRRKRGKFPDPAVRVFINELVCEGCGDCSAKSNCLSVVPVETEFGRKRAIDQSTCNKDYACVSGFCPSILTVHGGQLRRGKALQASDKLFADLPEPALPSLEKPVGILVAGVGGTGVVTIGALIGMAAHLEGKGVTVLDMTGLAQKGGAVMSHVRLAERQEQLHAPRLATGEADTLLGCDIVVAVGNDALVKTQPGRTRAIVNTGKAITGDFVRNPDHPFPLATMEGQIREAVGDGQADLLDASRLATLLMGHSIGTNLFMLGYAWQKGRVPLTQDALLRAIELNGVAVDDNKTAFLWGRRAAHDPAAVERLVAEAEPVLPTHELSKNLDETVARRRAALTDYQDAAYAQRYAALVERVRAAEKSVQPGSEVLTEAVARNYFKLLAYKDEYEVARLYSDPEFERTLASTFEGDYRLRFHLAIPLFSRTDPNTGLPKKFAYGGWMRAAMKPLAKLKFLRGSAFDPFGRTEERRLERALIGEYEQTVEKLLAGLRADSLPAAAEIARLPETIRGFGPIKLRNVTMARAKQAELMQRYGQLPQDARTAVAA
ncbi:MAG: indolepyruvate ferredoxin oxidoreductase family protein [Zoogloeaceae bacterium]|nr:indolepyruvate ferredoxin oxidoreductase family protein [Zoogloeaceae bacterium]MCK6383496.1 indolepyruvate ferredoxin oxidoreductase family protein [Rhodocyclaceae bacterium]